MGSDILCLSLVAGALSYAWYRSHARQGLPLPPGPPAEPILGHMRCIPSERPEYAFMQWGKEYGDVICLQFLGRTMIVLNSAQAAIDLLDRRSAIYSDRPKLLLYEIMGWTASDSLSIMRYGKRLARHRRIFQHFLSTKKCPTYQPIQLRETHILLQNLLKNSEKREQYFSRFSAAIAITLSCGHRVNSDDDEYVKIAEDAGFAVSTAGPAGNTPVDFLPFLQYLPKWVPGTYYAHHARDLKKYINRLRDYPLEQVKKQMAMGTAKPSFLTQHLDALRTDGDKKSYDEEDIKGAASTLYIAAADTTTTTLSVFLLAMVRHPELQKRAQKEIEEVTGGNRLPDFEDRGSMPFIDCLVWETLRWYNAVPLGVPHRLMEDDVYNGMFLPKGSMIIANTRAMTLDERVYSNPDQFIPSRYLPKPEGHNEPPPVGPFGFGRRVCPGRTLAEASLWIAIASILSVFDITKAIGEDGMEITPELNFTSGITCHPKPYQCRLTPRSEAAERLIINANISERY